MSVDYEEAAFPLTHASDCIDLALWWDVHGGGMREEQMTLNIKRSIKAIGWALEWLR